MNWVLFFGLFLFIVVIGLSIGIGWWFWRKSQNTKFTWQARCYQLAKGTTTFQGKDRLNISVKDLVPYVKDIIVREQPRFGVTYYRLAKQKISVDSVEADDVEVWGAEKIVDVLIVKGVAHILHKGYEPGTKTILHSIMSRNEIELMNSEREVKKRQIMGDKVNTLASIAMIIGFVVAFLSILFTAYFSSQVWLSAADAMDKQSESMDRFTDVIEPLLPLLIEKDINTSGTKVIKGNSVVTQTKPPLIE